MKIEPVADYNAVFASKQNKILKASLIKSQKMDGIQALKLASVFDKFATDLRNTMEAFIYMIKK